MKRCQICQLHKVGPTPQRQYANTININYTSVCKLSCDIKYMYTGSTGHKFTLVVTDEVTNYLVLCKVVHSYVCIYSLFLYMQIVLCL